MKLAFIFPFYRTKRTIFDGLPLSTPYLIGGLKTYFPDINFEQIDLNNEIDLLNSKKREFKNFIEIIKRIEDMCSQEGQARKMTSNIIPGSLLLPNDEEVNFFNNFFEKLFHLLNLKEFDHYFLSTYQIHDEDIFSLLLFAKFLKKKVPNKKIIIGGMRNFTKSMEDILNDIDYVDALITGEGIESCKRLIYDLKDKRHLKQLYDIPTPENQNIVCPDYSNFRNLSNFNIKANDLIQHFDILIENNNIKNNKILCLPYKFSSGCFWQKCAYCACSGIKRGLIHKEVSEIVSDIKILKKQANTKFFIFYNTNFNFKLSFAKQLASEFIKNKLNIIWTDSFNLNVLDDELIELLAKSGCIRMDIGLVSTDSKIQKLYNNIIQDNSYRDKLQKINKAGIWVNANVIANLPYIYDVDKEIEGFKKVVKHIDSVTINSYRAYGGSSMVESPEKFDLRVVNEKVMIGKFSNPMYFMEENFKGTVEDRKRLFVNNFIELYKFFRKNNVSTNSRTYYLLCLLYDVYGHKNKTKIRNKILSLK